MSILTSFDGKFQITALSFAPAVIAPGEETACTVTIKNISGKKIGSMYAVLRLFYPDETGAVRQSADNYLFGGPAYAMAAVNWASGAEKSFSCAFRFTPSGYAPVIESRLLPLYRGSDAGYSAAYGGDEVLGLMLSITTDADLGGRYSSGDIFFNLRGESSGHLAVIDARYLPAIPLFSAQRAEGGSPDDEGESLLIDLALATSASAKPENMSLALSWEGGSADISASIADALAGEICLSPDASFDKNADWPLTISFGDRYESASATLLIARAFANMHLSGASTGGVCFGSFSKATEGNPLFQCYYPAIFHAGIDGVTNYLSGETKTGGSWLDGKKIYRFLWQGTTTLDGAQGAVASLPAAPENVLSLRGMFKRSDGAWLPIPNAYFSSLNYAANIRTDADGNILVGLGSAYDGEKELIIIAEYTKQEE